MCHGEKINYHTFWLTFTTEYRKSPSAWENPLFQAIFNGRLSATTRGYPQSTGRKLMHGTHILLIHPSFHQYSRPIMVLLEGIRWSTADGTGPGTNAPSSLSLKDLALKSSPEGHHLFFLVQQKMGKNHGKKLMSSRKITHPIPIGWSGDSVRSSEPVPINGQFFFGNTFIPQTILFIAPS